MLTSDFLTSLKWFIFIRLIFGHYYYAGKIKIIKFFICMYCIIYTVFCSALFINFSGITLETLVTCYFTEFIIGCILTLLSRSAYISDILSLVSITGNILNVQSIAVSFKMFGSLIILFIIRIYVYVYYSSLGYILSFMLCFALLISVYVSDISKILFFDVLYHRMKNVREAFEYKYVYVNVIGKERVKHRIENIRSCLAAYDCVLQHVENLDIGIEIWLFSTLLIYFPKAVILMRIVMTLFLSKELFTLKTFWIALVLFFTFAVVIWPMVLFELAKKEADRIKDVLFKQYLVQSDEILRLETQRALQHVSLRPCQYRACRMLPMGIGLSLSFISLCITYVIVLVQLTPAK